MIEYTLLLNSHTIKIMIIRNANHPLRSTGQAQLNKIKVHQMDGQKYPYDYPGMYHELREVGGFVGFPDFVSDRSCNPVLDLYGNAIYNMNNECSEKTNFKDLD